MLHLILAGWIAVNGLVMQPPLEAWSDQNDHEEAIYVAAPEGACAVTLDQHTGVIKISMCDV